ncbi:TIGR02302 family protein [Algirhabdus cladophorae]|uniref:TIGR02302 family protein n=1 Tax=Algirhabdus cladophorae TaxID=3377108 RepID=UPI003B848975
MYQTPKLPKTAARAVFWTRIGLLSERVTRCFWPFWAVILLALAGLMFGLHEILSLEAIWSGLVVFALAGGTAAWWGLRRFVWPTHAEALERLDTSLPGRPITALFDEQAIGSADAASQIVWAAHVKRMAAKVAEARAVKGDLRVSKADPYATRFIAVIGFAAALLFGSIYQVGSVGAAIGQNPQLATGPSWEGWAEPPAYTGVPSIYLNDVDQEGLRLPQGTRITLRFYGEVGALTLAETVSGRTRDVDPASEPVQEFVILQNGDIRIDGANGRSWSVVAIPDGPPTVSISAKLQRKADGEMAQAFYARDDYAVVAGTGQFELDLPMIDRRFGLELEPEPRDALVVDLPMPITGDRAGFEETLIENFSEHPFANLGVVLAMQVEDEMGQTGRSSDIQMVLPGRRFFDPMAAALIEMRRDILWNRENATRAAQILRAVSQRPEDVFHTDTNYLRLRFIVRRLEAFAPYGMTDLQQEELSQALWDLAVRLEDGDVAGALARMQEAQERLSEAIKRGASDEEIAELMQDLRDATQDYIRQKAAEAQRNQENGEAGEESAQNQNPNSQTMSSDQLQEMMDRIQELMEQGRMAEAQELLDQLQEFMENMQVAEGQQGQGGGSPGEEAMEGLAESMREQQGLSDEAFRDLQEQFNPNAQAGESQGNQGRNGGQGQGESHEGGQQGEGEGEEGEGQQDQAQNGQNQEGAGGDQQGENLAQRQRALRQELNRQRGNMPGAGTQEGDAARDALGRAGEAMERAEDALRGNDLAGAIDNQAQAMEAMREGMRSLGEAMAQQQNQGDPGQGEQGQQGTAQNSQGQDPLGRDRSAQGALDQNQNVLQGEDVYRRARDLLDEIRRRSGDAERPQEELDYLKRLLERF